MTEPAKEESILPRTCIPRPKMENDCYDWYERHEEKCRQTLEKRYDVVFIGDSITHFWTGENGAPPYGEAVWREYYAKRSVLNLGFGYDRTQNVLWRLDHGELAGQEPKLIVLNIGTNQFSETPTYTADTPADAAAGIRAVVKKLRSMFPSARLVVMAIFPRSERRALQEKIDETNRLTGAFAETLPNVRFLDLKSRMTNPDGSLRKELFHICMTHPNESGYRVWAEAMEEEIRKSTGEK